jgi:hypothetical protein
MKEKIKLMKCILTAMVVFSTLMALPVEADAQVKVYAQLVDQEGGGVDENGYHVNCNVAVADGIQNSGNSDVIAFSLSIPVGTSRANFNRLIVDKAIEVVITAHPTWTLDAKDVFFQSWDNG